MFYESIFHGFILILPFAIEATICKFLLGSLYGSYALAEEFNHIADDITLIQELADLSIFFPLLLLRLGGTNRSYEFATFLDIMLSA